VSVFSRAVILRLSIAAVAWLAACGGGDGSTTPTPNPNPTPNAGFTLSVGTTTPTTIVQAGSGTATVTIARIGSFTGAVSLVLEGAPAGVTLATTPVVIASGTTSAVITINATLNVPAAVYPLTIRAQATGVADQTAPLSLTVVTRPASISLQRSTTAALSANAGGVPITFTVIINRVEYLGEVTFAVASGLPAGVTATFSAPTPGANSTGVQFAIGAATTPGTYTAELRATGTGISPATLSVPFTVLGPGSIVAGVSRPIVSILQNGSGLTSVTVARTNFTGSVTLALSGLPAGVTGTFDTNPIGTNGATLNFSAGPTVVPGTYPLTITATAPGVASGVVVMTLIVSAPTSGGNTSIRFCGPASEIPIWLGVQIGNSWTRVTIGANNTFTFDYPTIGSVAWVKQYGADDFRITVTSATRDEVALVAAGQCPSPSNRTATGIVAGLGAIDQVQLTFGPRAPTIAPTFASPAFSITGLPDGALDLLATRSTIESGAFIVNRVLMQRALNPSNGASLGTLDFGGSSAIIPETKSITIQGGAGGEQLFSSASLRSAGGAMISLGTSIFASGSSGTYRHVPVSQLQAGDFHSLQASASRSAGGVTTTRSVTQTVASPGAITVPLGIVPTEPNVFISSSDALRARYVSYIPFQTDYTRLYSTGWFQQAGGTRREIIVTVTERLAAITVGSLGTNAEIKSPNFTSAPGFDPLWETRPGVPATYFVSASGWAADGGFGAPLADGVQTRSYTKSGPVP
jgi:hypothetical protein